ncbi:MAG: hypothetical protein ACO31E_06505 [Phycisphaerales bacterium]
MTRPVHLLHDAAALARMLAIDTPCCTHIAMSTTGTPGAWGAFVDQNPLAGNWIVDAEIPCGRIVGYSGTLGDSLFADEPRTWMRPGHERFAAFLDEIVPALRDHGRTLCIRPHHRHEIGDVHAAVKMLRDRAGAPVEVLLSPADLLAPSMLGQLDEHLERMFAHLGPVAAGVLIADVAEADAGDGEGLLETRPIGEGVLPTDLLARLLVAHVPATTPVILRTGHDLAHQRGLIGL